ncbi:TPA: hypothetical protein ACG1DY_005060, partial [Escherichia coli]
QIERKNRIEQFSLSGRKNSDNIHMLRRTKITCGICGRVINISQHGTKDKPRYYLKHGRKKRVADGTVCDINFNTVRVDNNILKAMKEMLMGEEMAKKYLNLEINEAEIATIKEKIKESEKTLNKLHESLERLLDLYVLGKFKKEKYLEKEFEIESNIDQHKKMLQQFKAKLEAIDKKSWNYDTFYEYLEFVSDIETDVTNLERAQIFGRVFPNAILYTD